MTHMEKEKKDIAVTKAVAVEKAFVVTTAAKVVPRVIFSPLNNSVKIGIGGEVKVPATSTTVSNVIREATDKEYLIVAGYKHFAHLVYLKSDYE